jgi:hypothetical protein
MKKLSRDQGALDAPILSHRKIRQGADRESTPTRLRRRVGAQRATSAKRVMRDLAKFSCPCGTPRRSRQAGDPQI